MWDLAEDTHSIDLIEAFYGAGKPVAAVCHAPGVLHRVQFQGQPLVKGKRVTGFTNGEEEAVQLTKVVPFKRLTPTVFAPGGSLATDVEFRYLEQGGFAP
jgi:putative intracellular protease/amidase